jgi:hypothetical protein
MTKSKHQSPWRMLGSMTMFIIASIVLVAGMFVGASAGDAFGQLLASKDFVPALAASGVAMLVCTAGLAGIAYRVALLGVEMWRMRSSYGEDLSYVATMQPGLSTYEAMTRRTPMFKGLSAEAAGARMSG